MPEQGRQFAVRALRAAHARSDRLRTAAPAWRRAFPLLLASTLCACVEARFESPLAGSDTACDAGLVGAWVEAGGAADDGAPTAFEVGPDCVFTLIDRDPSGAPRRTRVPVRTVHAASADVLVVAADALAGLVELPPPAGASPGVPPGWFYAAYRRHGDHLALYPVDARRLARLAVDDALDADVSRTRNELHVFVHGSPASLLELVRREPIFDYKPTLELRRRAGTPSAAHPPSPRETSKEQP